MASLLAVLIAAGGNTEGGGVSACSIVLPKGPVLVAVSTTTDPNLLEAQIDTRPDIMILPSKIDFVSIDITTKRVSPGRAPNGVNVTAAPQAEADQTFGYRAAFESGCNPENLTLCSKWNYCCFCTS